MNKTIISALLSAVFLAACGGGGSGDSANTPGGTGTPSSVQAGTSTGILTDSPVGGVQYTTSGGYSGVTGADGSYAYNPGETVTFKIGNIVLGTVAATGTVTPLDLAAAATSKENVATNLLVLLQSLDADGNPANGITINDLAKTAAANASIDLTQAPATFASSSNTALVAVMNSAGVPKTAPVSEADALAHFSEQFFKQLAGTWTIAEAGAAITVRFNSAGDYIIGEAGPAEEGGSSGVEIGRINWDPKTGKISVVEGSITVDTNGEWGLSHPSGSEVFKFDGDKLVVSEGTDSTVFTRVASDATGLVGTWALGSATSMSTQTFTFFSNGTYVMADPVGDTDYSEPGDPKCGDAGVEFGTYSFNAATGVLSVNTAPKFDTNGCAGLWDKPANTSEPLTLVFASDKSTFTVDGATFYRVSK